MSRINAIGSLLSGAEQQQQLNTISALEAKWMVLGQQSSASREASLMQSGSGWTRPFASYIRSGCSSVSPSPFSSL
eukprot:2991206-Amphidinium_carterae.1